MEQMAARLEQLRKQVHLLETSMEARRRSHGGSDPAPGRGRTQALVARCFSSGN
ncbi:MAG: hypothetical protein IPM93_19970 [Candidatus Obscuribacter sp.]|nr:hypothetical protein [Candidatus Obscuribacter sp.]